MNITILGTGLVGRILADKLDHLGHDLTIGTRDPDATLARTDTGSIGDVSIPPYSHWQSEHPRVRLAPFAEAAAHSDVILNATQGAVSLDALALVGAENLAGKVLLDLALPLDFTGGFPPALTLSNNDSLGEQIQRTYPATKVVKSLTNVFCQVMVDPARIPGEHNTFLAGNDSDAKQTVRGILNELGWSSPSVIDLGNITSARAVELYSRLYFTLVDALGTFELNLHIVHVAAGTAGGR
ncbi:MULTISPECIES: NADPH-dependent F420 reductase [Tessaracoccus]|uniref:NADPH-dependent F420 reductase n=1 Tax=Tessaracoccus TaxID=72763 RepID=UPI00099DC075|nr:MULTISPECIES: NAD(P)-binding domain-containing protein [Tessaracoccus]AQX16960.1 NADP oxidoreductase [Tessaracoccus sp. T2.5-30]VEP41795.1 hypothetical protein TLA_TLA_02883 [Tessaracoccus lapidicaptus]